MADKSAVAPAASTGDQSPPVTEALVADHEAPLAVAEHLADTEDNDSTLESGLADSTASLSSSILQYRTIQGRTYHSERHDTQYFTPNDERQAESIDIVHHYITLLLGGKLHLAPIKDDVQKVADIGTGSGIWAVDFGDQHPSAEVIGTDLSPMQPSWVPPNVKFEIDDATKPWTWPDNTFDYIHIRFLNGAVKDWPALFREAYRCLKPGGYVESGEFDPRYYSDDGTGDKDEVIKTWNKVFEEGGKKIGNSFTILEDDVTKTGIKEAGFEDIHAVPFKAPVGPWAANKQLAEVGSYLQMTLENDMEGYTLFLCTSILGWSPEEFQVFLMSMRKVLRNTKNIHLYVKYLYVYARKPGGPAAA